LRESEYESAMSNEKNISRRSALKVIAVGVGTATTLPILNNNALGQQGAHDTQKAAATIAPAKAGGRFFTPHELETVDSISNLIIPADEHSPGASAAGTYAFIDLMVSESSDEVKKLWRDGLAAVDKMSETRSSAAFLRSSQEQQIALLKAISRNERRPTAIEEQFFVAIK